MKFKLFVLFALFIFKGYSQEEEQINEKVIFVSPNYELQFPLGDMKTDFGINSSLGIELSLITSKNIYLSFNTSLIFGNNVNDTTILDHLMDENQNIIDENVPTKWGDISVTKAIIALLRAAYKDPNNKKFCLFSEVVHR